MSNTDFPKMPEARRNGTRVQFPCRLSYAHLKEPYAYGDGDKPKYSGCLIIPKTDTKTLGVLQAAIQEANNQGKITLWKGNDRGKIGNPLWDGDIPNEDTGETRPENEGCYYMNAKSSKPVGTFAPGAMPLPKIDPEDCYSGCYVIASVNFYPYAVGAKRGVGAGLNALVKMADGERLGGNGTGENDFNGFDFGLTELTGVDPNNPW